MHYGALCIVAVPVYHPFEADTYLLMQDTRNLDQISFFYDFIKEIDIVPPGIWDVCQVLDILLYCCGNQIYIYI